jgi:hypothetical protein
MCAPERALCSLLPFAACGLSLVRPASAQAPTPEVCRNCDNPVFASRESHWIDLKPVQSAHFIV